MRNQAVPYNSMKSLGVRGHMGRIHCRDNDDHVAGLLCVAALSPHHAIDFQASPLRFQALVPSYDRLDPIAATPNTPAPIATGCFSIDLAEMPGVPKKAQSCLVYAFHREILEGPVTTGVIEPERAPGR